MKGKEQAGGSGAAPLAAGRALGARTGSVLWCLVWLGAPQEAGERFKSCPRGWGAALGVPAGWPSVGHAAVGLAVEASLRPLELNFVDLGNNLARRRWQRGSSRSEARVWPLSRASDETRCVRWHKEASGEPGSALPA